MGVESSAYVALRSISLAISGNRECLPLYYRGLGWMLHSNKELTSLCFSWRVHTVACRSKLAPFTAGYYINLSDADPKGTDRNYGPNFGRLAELKKRYDPQNLFRLNANIKPG